MSTATPSKWLMALAIVMVLILVLFIMGFWNAVYVSGSLSICAGPFTLIEILALILAVAGVFVINNYLGRGRVSDLLLIIFVVLLVIFTISFYLLSVSSYAGIC